MLVELYIYGKRAADAIEQHAQSFFKVILDMSHIRSDPADAGAKRKGDARLAAIMQFRIQRKRALQQMIERLQKGQSTSPISSTAQQEL